MDPRDDDVLENEPPRPRRGILAVVAACGIVALALLAFVRLGDRDRPDDRPTPSTGTWSASASWPAAQGACGQVELPLVSAAEPPESTGLRVVVGGVQLASFDVDSGRSQLRLDLAGEHRWIEHLVRHGDDVYATTRPCRSGGVGVLRDSGRGTPRFVELSGPVEGLIGGPAGVWGVRRLLGEDDRVLLRGVSGRDVLLSQGMYPRGVTATGIVGEGPDEDDLAAGRAMYLLDPATGKVERRIGHGDVRAVGRDVVLWSGSDCRFIPGEDSTPVPKRTCVLHATSPTGVGRSTRHPLPDNRTPAGPIVLSGDDRYAAFQLSRPRQELHFADEHPWTPSEVAVLDLHTGKLRTVPDLRLPMKTTAGIAFSPDGRWLVVTTNRGDHGHLFVWRQGDDRLRRSPVRIAGPVAYTVPVLVTG